MMMNTFDLHPKSQLNALKVALQKWLTDIDSDFGMAWLGLGTTLTQQRQLLTSARPSEFYILLISPH